MNTNTHQIVKQVDYKTTYVSIETPGCCGTSFNMELTEKDTGKGIYQIIKEGKIECEINTKNITIDKLNKIIKDIFVDIDNIPTTSSAIAAFTLPNGDKV